MWGRWLAVGGVLLGLTGGTGCGEPDSGVWGREAEAWLGAYDTAFARNDGGTVLFYDEDIVSNHTMMGGTGDELLVVGRNKAAEVERYVYGMDYWWGPVFLSADSAVRIDLWSVAGVSDGGLAEIVIGPGGMERYTHHAATYYGSGHLSDRQVETAEVALEIAERYSAAWGPADEALFEQLYAAGATLEDSIVGESAESAEEILALARGTAGTMDIAALGDAAPPVALNTYPNPISAHSPVVFQRLQPNRYGDLSEVWVLVESEAQCPGQWYAALRLDRDGAVVAERRFRSIESIRECVDPADRVTGWWTDRELPRPFGERVTGTFETETGPVEIRNGSTGSTALLAWAFGRYPLAGLPAPAVSSIVFDPLDERCEEMAGYADWSDGATRILVCFDSSDVTPPEPVVGSTSEVADERALWGGRLLLHELSHAWVHEETSEETRAGLMELVGATSWNDRGDPWAERGVEWAAESVVWGLRGTPGGSLPLHQSESDCSLLADGYRLLTGEEPLTPCPAAG